MNDENSTSLSVDTNFTEKHHKHLNHTNHYTTITAELNDTNGIFLSNKQIFTLILPYSIIFLLAIIGNALVIITLGANRRMRSVTNLFLLNLAISDLLLGVFCMPFTLVGVLLQEFIFGSLMCSLISYLQAVSVSVSAWTLVVMSVERYYAICHPLKSRESRQTLSHAYRMIAIVWVSSFAAMSPIAFVSELQTFQHSGKFKCRESWPSELSFEMFTIFLDVSLLVVPLIIMSLTYSMIALTLKNNLRQSIGKKGNSLRSEVSNGCNGKTTREDSVYRSCSAADTTVSTKQYCEKPRVTALRSNTDPLVAAARQRRVIKMLFTVVLEFFVCWTPIYVINTIVIYSPKLIYKGLGYNGVSFFHLLAFFSSCTNPITYCFMNSKFRESFVSLFRCPDSSNNSDYITSVAFTPQSVRSQHNNHRASSKDNTGSAYTPALTRKALLHAKVSNSSDAESELNVELNSKIY